MAVRRRKKRSTDDFKPQNVIKELERVFSLPLPTSVGDCALEIELLGNRQRVLGQQLQELARVDLEIKDSSSSVEKICVKSADTYTEDTVSPVSVKSPSAVIKQEDLRKLPAQYSVSNLNATRISENLGSMGSKLGEVTDNTQSSPLILALKKLQEQNGVRREIKDWINNLACLFRVADADSSGRIKPEEYLQMLNRLDISEGLKTSLSSEFDDIDDNSSGQINIREFLSYFLVHPKFYDELIRHAHSNAPFLYENRLNKSQGWRLYLYNIVEVPHYNALSKTIFCTDCVLAILPTVALFVQSVRPSQFIDWKETVYLWMISIFFALQYLCGLLTCKSPLKYITDTWHIIDFISFAFWIIWKSSMTSGSLNPEGFVIFRTLRILKIFAVFNFTTLYEDLKVYNDTIRLAYTSYETVAGFMIYIIVFFSLLIYVFERGTFDPDENMWVRDEYEGESPFSNFYNCLYFTGVTMTTVGYGDFSAKSEMGKLVALMSACCGVCNITLLINIIGECFEEVFREFVKRRSNKIQKDSVEYIRKHINRASKSVISAQLRMQRGNFPHRQESEIWSANQKNIQFQTLSDPMNTTLDNKQITEVV